MSEPKMRSQQVANVSQRMLEDLTRAIESGQFQPGQALPTARDLGEQYDVSFSTAQRVVAHLQRLGLVYSDYVEGRRGVYVRRQGREDFVASDALRPQRPADGPDAFTENAHKTGREPSKRFDMVMLRPPAEIADRLGIDRSDLVVQRTTLQLLDREPWSRERSWYPRDLAEEVGLDTPDDIPQGTKRKLEEAGYVEVAHRNEITDASASQDDANDLGVILGAPLLRQLRTAVTLERITRVTETIWLSGRTRIVYELGDEEALQIIRANRTTPDE